MDVPTNKSHACIHELVTEVKAFYELRLPTRDSRLIAARSVRGERSLNRIAIAIGDERTPLRDSPAITYAFPSGIETSDTVRIDIARQRRLSRPLTMARRPAKTSATSGPVRRNQQSSDPVRACCFRQHHLRYCCRGHLFRRRYASVLWPPMT